MKKKIPKKLEKVLSEVPKGLPFALRCLTTAGHLHSNGFEVQEDTPEVDYPGCRYIFAPLPAFEDDGSYQGHINMMFEVRANMLVSLKDTANECNVTIRTIQRWRDEKKIPVVTIKRKQYFPIEIAKDYAARQGHIPGRKRWR